MKNFFKILLLAVAAVSVVGCDKAATADAEYRHHAFKSLLPSIEAGIYNTYLKQKFGYSTDYFSLKNTVVNNHSVKTKSGKYRINQPMTITQNSANQLAPLFCRYINEIRIDEAAIKAGRYASSKQTISEIYKKSFGVDLYDSCEVAVLPKTVQETESVVEVVEELEVVSIDSEKVISPELYDRLISSVGTCKRANARLITLTDGDRYLTQTDYNEVMGIIMSCKRFELENAVNSVN